MNNLEVNFIVKNEKFEENDVNLFFGPIEETDEFKLLDEKCTVADVLVKSGIFSSKSQARKSQFVFSLGMEIPFGFTLLERVGKFNKTIAILNIQ